MKNVILILALVLVGCADGADVDVTADEQALQTGDASCSTSDGSPCFCGTAGCDGDPASGGGGTGGSGGGGGGGGGLCTVRTVCNTGWWCQRAAACWDDDYYPRTGYRERYCAQQTTCLGITTTGPAYSELVLDMAMCEYDEC